MEFTVSIEELERAIKALKPVRARGFTSSLAVFRMTSAGWDIGSCKASFSDVLEKAHPTDPSMDWGRCQGVHRHFKFQDGKLVRVRQLPWKKA